MAGILDNVLDTYKQRKQPAAAGGGNNILAPGAAVAAGVLPTAFEAAKLRANPAPRMTADGMPIGAEPMQSNLAPPAKPLLSAQQVVQRNLTPGPMQAVSGQPLTAAGPGSNIQPARTLPTVSFANPNAVAAGGPVGNGFLTGPGIEKPMIDPAIAAGGAAAAERVAANQAAMTGAMRAGGAVPAVEAAAPAAAKMAGSFLPWAGRLAGKAMYADTTKLGVMADDIMAGGADYVDRVLGTREPQDLRSDYEKQAEAKRGVNSASGVPVSRLDQMVAAENPIYQSGPSVSFANPNAVAAGGPVGNGFLTGPGIEKPMIDPAIAAGGAVAPVPMMPGAIAPITDDKSQIPKSAGNKGFFLNPNISVNGQSQFTAGPNGRTVIKPGETVINKGQGPEGLAIATDPVTGRVVNVAGKDWNLNGHADPPPTSDFTPTPGADSGNNFMRSQAVQEQMAINRGTTSNDTRAQRRGNAFLARRREDANQANAREDAATATKNAHDEKQLDLIYGLARTRAMADAIARGAEAKNLSAQEIKLQQLEARLAPEQRRIITEALKADKVAGPEFEKILNLQDTEEALSKAKKPAVVSVDTGKKSKFLGRPVMEDVPIPELIARSRAIIAQRQEEMMQQRGMLGEPAEQTAGRGAGNGQQIDKALEWLQANPMHPKASAVSAKIGQLVGTG